MRLDSQKDHPLVSIIIPAFNVEQYIIQCLESVINQSYTNLEIIVVDDGSTDRTRDILVKYSTLDSRIHAITQTNHGVSFSRNIGLDYCLGEFVLFLDADDWLDRDAISILVSIANRDVDVVMYPFVCFDYVNNKIIKVQQFPSHCSLAELQQYGPVLSGFPTYICNYFFRKSAIGSNRFSEEISYAEDCLFIHNITTNKLKYLVIDKPLYYYRVNRPGSALTEISLEGCECIKIVRKIVLDYALQCNYYQNALIQYGVSSFGVLRRSAFSKSLFRANCIEPRHRVWLLIKSKSVKAVLYAFACIFPFVMRPFFLFLGLYSTRFRIH